MVATRSGRLYGSITGPLYGGGVGAGAGLGVGVGPPAGGGVGASAGGTIIISPLYGVILKVARPITETSLSLFLIKLIVSGTSREEFSFQIATKRTEFLFPSAKELLHGIELDAFSSSKLFLQSYRNIYDPSEFLFSCVQLISKVFKGSTGCGLIDTFILSSLVSEDEKIPARLGRERDDPMKRTP